MAHRRGMQDGVARRDGVDFRRIGMARHRQRAVREHGALRSACCARSVEQPGEVVATAWRKRDRVGGKQRLVLHAADGDQPFEAFRRVRCNLVIEPGRGKAHARAGMFENITELGAVQLGIGRHRGKSGVPDAEQQFDIRL